MPRVSLSTAALLAACAPVAENLRLTPEQWREDVRYFAQKLPPRHPGAFAVTPRTEFERAVAQLDGDISQVDADAIYVGLDRIANGIGDGHTYVRFPRDKGNLLIEIARFGHDYRIVAVTQGMEEALGARVISVNQVPVARVRELILPLTPLAELANLREDRVTAFLTIGMVLHGIGVTPDRNAASYQLESDDGRQFTVEFHSTPVGTPVTWVHAYRSPPLYLTHPGEPFWCETIAEHHALYCNVRLMRDLGGPGRRLVARVKSEKPSKLILDLRENGGGDYTEGEACLINPLRDLAEVNVRGHLFVLIGTETFSAAMNNAAQFKTNTAAVLLGETIGERPNSYQEVEEMNLPNSHLTVRYSTRFYTFMKQGENVVAPDETVIPSWKQYAAGEDPVLERALHWSPH